MRRLALAFAALVSCTHAPQPTPAPPPPAAAPQLDADQAFERLEREYVVEFLRRNPTVSTYLGGAGFDPRLAEADGRLRDHSPEALAAEDAWLEGVQRAFEAASPTRTALKIDREVALAQVRFLLHQHRERHYAERALDTYTDEPFRAVDWAMQGFTPTGDTTAGTSAEWRTLAVRLRAVGPYLAAARTQLEAGVRSGRTPDARMLVRNGLDGCAASADYFESMLPRLAAERLAAGAEREALLADVQAAAREAAQAYRTLRTFLATTFFDAPDKREAGVKPAFAGDRYAMGEAEYDWALKNNLRQDKRAAQLYEQGWPAVEATRNEMIALAREIGQRRKLRLPKDGNAAVRAVFDALSRDAPKDDEQMLQGYRDAAFRLVEYARKTGLFDVPRDYALEVVLTPEPLRASVEGAAYYPAPPFKGTGVGRYYVSPTGNDPAALAANNFAAMADLSAHEGFPGHDWHYKVLTRFKDDFGPVRWLTPGAVEDSSSMWQDSMASEGWALYAEALMAEPREGAPHGFYTPEEKLYQLGGQLYRDLRVPVDIGLHTGRLSYAKAVDLFSEVTDFLPGSCQDAKALRLPAKRASCRASEGAIYRYSKWPTQAITYRLGKQNILALRREAEGALGPAFDLQRFHLEYMRQGTIPAGYFRDVLLEALRAPAPH